MNVSINIYYITVVLFFILIYIHQKIFVVGKENSSIWSTENKFYKKLFNLMLLGLILPIIFIVLKNKVILYPNEIIFEIKNIIYIQESFSIEEKKEYLKIFMSYLEKMWNIKKDDCLFIVEQIQLKINETTVLKDIRDFVEELLKEMQKQKYEEPKILSIKEKIQKGIEEIVKYIRRK